MLQLALQDVSLLTTLAAGFAAAWFFGLIMQRLGLSPIVGYLLAGVAIGPHTPGIEGDQNLAQQLADIGVILLMFGVGLEFHFKDLLAVRKIAVPGAIVQSLVTTVVAALVFQLFGWPLRAGIVLGMAMSVASTVVLVRVLMSKNMVRSVHGRAAVGWLIVEDIFTVLALVLVPAIAAPGGDNEFNVVVTIGWTLVKLAALVAIVFLAGSRIVPWVLVQVARLRSRELFTLTVLVLSITVAAASAYLFGASVALGAFLAGMVVGQSSVSHQAASNVLPLRDAFAVLFFVSVGMLFDPSFVMEQPLMVAAGVIIVLAIKPLTALIIVAVLGYSVRTALTVAIGLGQIGEFSFILSQVALTHGVMPEAGHHVLVATAMISITLNTVAFMTLDRVEKLLQRMPVVWKLLSGRADRRMQQVNEAAVEQLAKVEKPLAIIVGYGPVGRVVDALLRDTGLETVIIDMNMDSIRSLTDRDRLGVFGDATRMDTLEQAGVRKAVYLVVTLPYTTNWRPLVLAAQELNPSIEIAVRARYLSEREALRQAGVDAMVFEEGEAGMALAKLVMKHQKVDDATADRLLRALRRMWSLQE